MKKAFILIFCQFIILLAHSQENLFIVEDSITGLKGCMNLSKEMVVPCEYEDLIPIGDGYFCSVKNSKVGIINSVGNECVPTIYGYGGLPDSDNKVFYVPKDGKYGLIDFNNNVLIPFQYDEMYHETNNDLLCVKKDGKYGLISLKLKKEVLPCKYDQIKMGRVLFDNGTYRVYNDRPSALIAILYNSKWGFVDPEGNVVIPCQYEDLTEYDDDGTPLYGGDPARYHYIYYGGRVPFVKNGKVGLLDEKGNVIIPAIYKNIDLIGDNNSGNYPTATTFSNKQVLIDTDNKIVSKEYDEIEAVDEDFAVYKMGSKYGLISLPDCKVVTEAKYDDFRCPNEGFIRCEKERKYGYINKAGQEVFRPEFDGGGAFSNGYCCVNKDGKYGFIKAYGYSGIYIDCEYDEESYVDKYGIAILRKNGRYGAINTMKKNLIPFEYNKIERYCGKGWHKEKKFDGFYRVKKDNLYGYYNKSGRIVVPCQYSEDMCEIEKRLYIAQNGKTITNGNSSVSTEELIVKSMELASSDLSARINTRDLNGVPCALVRVMLKDSDPKFEGGVVGNIKQLGMQYLIYMPVGTKYLRVVPADHFPIMISFADYGINGLESKTTYDLILVASPK
jgi:hypothetical protein